MGRLRTNPNCPVWKFFTRLVIENSDAKKAVCKLCNQVYSYQTTMTNLAHHLSFKHPEQHLALAKLRAIAAKQKADLEKKVGYRTSLNEDDSNFPLHQSTAAASEEVFLIEGAESKEKWRNIPSVFVRNMKPGKSGAGAGAKNKEPYYLNEVITLPFIELSTASVSGNLEMPIDEINHPDIDEMMTVEDDGSQAVLNNLFNSTHMFNTQTSTEDRPIPTSSPRSPYSVMTPTPQSRPLPTSPHSSSMSIPSRPAQSQPLPTTSNLSTKKKFRTTKNSTDEGILDYCKAKQARAETTTNNLKKMFLLSLLPDLEPMSDGQMRKFKRGVMKLIDDIIEDTPAKPSTLNSSQITLYYKAAGRDFTTPLS